MMKHLKKLCLLILCLLLPTAALAEVYVGQRSPEEWKDKEIMRLAQLDTNRSDCLLLECGGESMIIDGGYASFRQDVADYLKLRGLEHLTYMFNTHPHDDHLPGLTSLVQMGFTANAFLSPFEKEYNDSFQKKAVRALEKAGIPYWQVGDKYEMTVGGVQILVRTREKSTDANRRSAVLRLTYGNSVALLLANIPRLVQEELLEDMGADALKCDVCKAPHHGITPFNIPFLEAIAPKVVTIPTNSKHPDTISVQCKGRDIPYFKSGDGLVIMETDGTDWYIWQLPQGEWE